MFKEMRYRILGVTNEVTTCHCCGKENLKKTVVLDDYEGNVTYYGETCASKQVKMNVNDFKKEVTNSIKTRKEDKEKFIKSHPAMQEYNKLVNKIQEKNLTFKQRIELGYIAKLNELQIIATEEANKLYEYI